MLTQTDKSHLPDLLVAPHPAITLGVHVESGVYIDLLLPQDNGTSQVPEMKKGYQQALKKRNDP